MANRVRITDAQRIAERVHADAVVVIAFTGEQFSMTSYGTTKQKCAIAGRWVDRVAADLESGALPAPVL